MIINEGGICEPGGELGPPMVKIVQEHFWKVWSKQIISCQSVAIFKACKLVVFGFPSVFIFSSGVSVFVFVFLENLGNGLTSDP